MKQTTPTCEVHGVRLVCPCCIGKKGGVERKKRYSQATMSAWGKMGGRPRKKKPAVQ